MSAQLRYAYLKGHTWLYRRNYPKDVAVVLGTQALKQSLRTGDIATARQRASEVNARYEATVGKVLEGATLVTTGASGWSEGGSDPLALLRAALEHSDITPFSRPTEEPKVTVQETSRRYLLERQQDLRPGGFKSVRYSVELFESLNGGLAVTELGREQGKEFLGLIAQLSPVIGKSPKTRGLGLQALVKWSTLGPERITARTQRRIWSQINHWLDWLVYEGLTEQNPFKTVRFDLKVKQAPYAVPTDQEVKLLLGARDPMIGKVLRVCLLTGLRAGEAVGLLRQDLI